ncbi:MAG: GntR family transcriptional regulator, partial [Desulfovibrionales bacterium]|nr:GntR family transcriptional regulator [Desulfovibrionales bacterium]
MPPQKKADAVRTALDGIKGMLFTNAISPGQKISYRQLAEELGLSLTPVIQALKHLEVQGLVRHEPHRGYSTEPMSIQEVQDIYDTRELIEVSLIPDIIHNLDQEGIQTLKGLLDQPPLPPNAVNKRLIRDRDFHLTLAGLSRRRVQVQILNQLFDLL